MMNKEGGGIFELDEKITAGSEFYGGNSYGGNAYGGNDYNGGKVKGLELQLDDKVSEQSYEVKTYKTKASPKAIKSANLTDGLGDSSNINKTSNNKTKKTIDTDIYDPISLQDFKNLPLKTYIKLRTSDGNIIQGTIQSKTDSEMLIGKYNMAIGRYYKNKVEYSDIKDTYIINKERADKKYPKKGEPREKKQRGRKPREQTMQQPRVVNPQNLSLPQQNVLAQQAAQIQQQQQSMLKSQQQEQFQQMQQMQSAMQTQPQQPYSQSTPQNQGQYANPNNYGQRANDSSESNDIMLELGNKLLFDEADIIKTKIKTLEEKVSELEEDKRKMFNVIKIMYKKIMTSN